ncbi:MULTISPECIES: spinster family MFS transporter [unclassified Sphingomonas]|uniref:spinster family MFS transporter n=1 Tax=unclassified Sphingomonas TaxID=196159 RepID=UPI0021509CF0|nr:MULTISPECIES: MFS transporter [unclassified Sphingomonas]MCR5869647.1 MFS transporter [Sphingomonas sp. J344]UUX98641.1 MFS transporter [Sphingomonas sp. J315]
MAMISAPADPVPEGADDRAIRRRGLTLALLTVTYFFSYMDRQILAILQELIKKDLGLSDTQLGMLTGLAFAVFYAGLGIPVARLADRMNRRNIIAISLTVWSAFTAACGLAQNFVQLLLFRIGVGIGEAGSSPPSHSIIADLYPPEKRAGAMAIYSLGVVLGTAFGTMIGGTVAHYYGWRVALFAVGLPGVLLAFFVWKLVVEPRRGLSDAVKVAEGEAMPSLGEAFAGMWRNKAAVHVVLGVTLTSMIGYGLAAFGPSYMQRSLDMNLLQIAWIVAPILGVVGALSAVLGGRLADWLAKTRGMHAQSYMVALLKVIALPFALMFYWLDSWQLALSAYVVALLFQNSYLGPSFAMIQSLAPQKVRALWAAITLLVINMIGLGIGPVAVGRLSDALNPTYGEDSLRYAMLIFAAITPWAIFHYWRAGVWLKRREAAV